MKVKRLREIRASLRLTQAQMADKFMVSLPTYKRWERDIHGGGDDEASCIHPFQAAFLESVVSHENCWPDDMVTVARGEWVASLMKQIKDLEHLVLNRIVDFENPPCPKCKNDKVQRQQIDDEDDELWCFNGCGHRAKIDCNVNAWPEFDEVET